MCLPSLTSPRMHRQRVRGRPTENSDCVVQQRRNSMICVVKLFIQILLALTHLSFRRHVNDGIAEAIPEDGNLRQPPNECSLRAIPASVRRHDRIRRGRGVCRVRRRRIVDRDQWRRPAEEIHPRRGRDEAQSRI